jgi:chaperonin GroES
METKTRDFLREAADMSLRRVPTRISEEQIQALQSEFECLEANVLVKILEGEETVKAGIIRPGAMRNQEAVVLLVGPGEWIGQTFVKTDLEPGDKVLVTKFGGTNVELDGNQFLLVHRKQIYLRRKPKP